MDSASGKHIWSGPAPAVRESPLQGRGPRPLHPCPPLPQGVSVRAWEEGAWASPHKARRKYRGWGLVTHSDGAGMLWSEQDPAPEPPSCPRAPLEDSASSHTVTLAAPTCQVAGGDPGFSPPAGCPTAQGCPVPPPAIAAGCGGCGGRRAPDLGWELVPGQRN